MVQRGSPDWKLAAPPQTTTLGGKPAVAVTLQFTYKQIPVLSDCWVVPRPETHQLYLVAFSDRADHHNQSAPTFTWLAQHVHFSW
jgi:hypothetical protein